MLLVQCVEDDDFIYAVHELRREIPAGRLHSRALDLLVNSNLALVQVVQFSRRGKTDPSFDQFGQPKMLLPSAVHF